MSNGNFCRVSDFALVSVALPDRSPHLLLLPRQKIAKQRLTVAVQDNQIGRCPNSRGPKLHRPLESKLVIRRATNRHRYPSRSANDELYDRCQHL